MNERDRIIVGKIIAYCKEIGDTHIYFNNDKTLFFNKEKGFVYRNSITMPILQIGELTKNLSEEFKSSNKDIPWRDVAGIRDIFAHHYGSLDYEMTWNTSKEDIGDLEAILQRLLD